MHSRAAPRVAEAIHELIQERPDLRARLDQAAARMLSASLRAGGLQAPAPGSTSTSGWQPRT